MSSGLRRPNSGKTSVARALAEKRGLRAYHHDLHDRDEPPATGFRTGSHATAVYTDPDQWSDWMWVDTTLEELVERWLQTTLERFQPHQEDLPATPSAPPAVMRAMDSHPTWCVPLLTSTRQAIWVDIDGGIQASNLPESGQGSFADTRDPPRARTSATAQPPPRSTETLLRSAGCRAGD